MVFLKTGVGEDESLGIYKILIRRCLFCFGLGVIYWDGGLLWKGSQEQMGDASLKYLGPPWWRCSQAALCRVLCPFHYPAPGPQEQLAEMPLNRQAPNVLAESPAAWAACDCHLDPQSRPSCWFIMQLRGKAETALLFFLNLIVLTAKRESM